MAESPQGPEPAPVGAQQNRELLRLLLLPEHSGRHLGDLARGWPEGPHGDVPVQVALRLAYERVLDGLATLLTLDLLSVDEADGIVARISGALARQAQPRRWEGW